MIVKKYPSEVVDVQNKIEGIFTIEFASLKGRYKFYPGQFLHLALEEYDPSSNWPESRCFSMQTPPESDKLKITFAIKGEFTKRMADTLQTGTRVTLKLPYGDLFTQSHDKTKSVFIAGGTGITPFLSLFAHTSFESYSQPKLYAGFRTKEMNIYSDELTIANTINPGLTISSIYEDESGMLNINNILDENGTESTYFISGPPVMIKDFKGFLSSNGVPQDRIKTDDWE